MNMIKTTLILILLISTVLSQSVNIIDNDSNINLQINDEGKDGSSITIPEAGVTLTSIVNKLYQDHDELTWSGLVLGTEDESGWTDGGTTVRLQTLSDNVGIGVTSATSKLDVAGTVNTSGDFKIDGLVFLKDSHRPSTTDLGTYLGAEAGHNILGTGDDYNNHALGYRALYSLSGDEFNTAVGWKAVHSLVQNARSTAIGYSAISSQTEYSSCTAIGSLILVASDRSSNTGVGAFTFNEEVNGSGSTAVGTNALMKNNGDLEPQNTAIGADCLKNNTTGKQNVATGYKAMEGNITGSNNVAIGTNAGNSTAGSANSGNVFIGYNVGLNAVCDDKLYIDNSSTSTPLIWGDFTDGSEVVRINGDLEYTGDISHVSDILLKENIHELENTIEKIQGIRGISFDWNDEAKNSLVVNDVSQIGVIAQEVEKVYPEIVTANSQGFMGVDYSKLSVILLEVVKEQQMIIKDLEEYFNILTHRL